MIEIRENEFVHGLFSITERDSSFWTVKDRQDVAPPMDY